MTQKHLMTVIVSSLIVAVPASAQDFSSMGYNVTMAGIMHKQKMKAVYGSKAIELAAPRLAGSQRPAGGLASLLGGNRTAPAPIASLAYSPDKATSRAVEKDFLDRVSKYDASVGASVKQEFSRHDPVKIYRDISRQYGVPFRDLAGTMAAYNVLAWLIANGEMEPPAGALESARMQTAQILTTDPKFQSEQTRREMDEELMRHFVVMHAGWQSAVQREGPAALKGLSDGVANLWRTQFGKDLRALDLTSQGFRDRS